MQLEGVTISNRLATKATGMSDNFANKIMNKFEPNM
jgi:hypothetical protein